jgi:hypothetical protein
MKQGDRERQARNTKEIKEGKQKQKEVGGTK